MEGESCGLEVERTKIETLPNPNIWQCDPITGASGDHVLEVATTSDYATSSNAISVDVHPPQLGDIDRLHITTEGVSIALPRSYGNTRTPAPYILMAGGTESAQEGPSSTSDGRNRGPPATSSGQNAEQDGRRPRSSFQEYLPLLLFAIGTVTILRIAAYRGKIPKA